MRVNDTVAIHLLSRFDGRLRTLCVSHSQREEDGGNISSSQTGERPPSFTRYGIPGVLEILFSSPPKFWNISNALHQKPLVCRGVFIYRLATLLPLRLPADSIFGVIVIRNFFFWIQRCQVFFFQKRRKKISSIFFSRSVGGGGRGQQRGEETCLWGRPSTTIYCVVCVCVWVLSTETHTHTKKPLTTETLVSFVF